MKRVIPISLMMVAMSTAWSADTSAIIDTYQSKTQQQFEAEKGAGLWAKAGKEGRTCGDCHGVNPTQPGKHVRTGKRIGPMAASVDAKRYRDQKKIEKWFKRNCKWTWGRECTAVEKGHLLTWLVKQ